MSARFLLLRLHAAWTVAACGVLLAAGTPRAQTLRADAARAEAPLELWYHHLRDIDGLPQNFVTDIAQDSTGYLWFGTVGGLARFDGREILTFQPDPNDSTSVPGMTIMALTVAADGTLWVGTQDNGLARYRLNGSFERYPFAGAPDAPGLPPTVLTIAEAPDGALWITGDSRLVRFEHATGEVRRIDTGPHQPNAGLLMLGEAVWVGAENHLLRFDLTGDRSEAIPIPASLARERFDRVSTLVASPSGHLWLGTTDGLLRFDPATRRFDDYGDQPRLSGLIQNLTAHGDDAVLVLSDAGLTFLDPLDGVAVPVLDSFYDLPSLPGLLPFVSIFISSDGVLWLGSNGTGILYADLRTSRFPLFGHIPGDPTTLANAFVRSITADSATAWIGTSRGGLNRMDVATRAITRLPNDVLSPAFDGQQTAWGLDLDRSGALWAIYADRFERRDGQTGRLLDRYAMPDAYPPALVPTFLYEDPQGRHWVGTPTFGTLDPESGRFAAALGTPEARLPVHRLHPAADGTFWLATSGNGLVRYDPDTGASTAYRPTPGDTTSVSSDNVQSLWATDDGTLWLGTLAGLNRFDPGTGTAVRYTSQNSGLPDNYINGVLGDSRGHLWISTNQGLTRFDPETEVFVTYAVDRGLQSSEFNRGAYERAPDGTMLFGGIEGLNVFDPLLLVDNPVPPQLALSGLLVNGTPVHLPGGARLSAPLAPDQNTLLFRYTALHFSNPALNRFQYRLGGHDADWSATTKNADVRYTNLPPGDYAFHLRAANPFGVWSEDATLLAFTIRPPVWATWWFRLLAFGLGLTVLAAAAGYRYRATRQREAELRRSVAERTADLQAEKELTEQQAAALFTQSQQQQQLFADISHETRTPLTLILSPVEQLLGGDLDAAVRRQLTLVQRSARRLLYYIDQMLDLARLESGSKALQPRRIELASFVEGVAEAFGPLAEGHGLRIAADVPPAPFEAEADPAMLEVVLFNLIGNAVKFTPAGGTVRVTLSGDAGHVVLTVADTGVGIPADALAHVFDRFERVFPEQPGTGIGLALVREIVLAHGGQVDVASTVGEGTTFTVRWPRVRLAGDALPLLSYTSKADPGLLLFATPSPAAPPPEDSPTLLVVDDNHDVRGYLGDLLAESYHVVVATDGDEALVQARALVPDLIVSDVRMPGLGGFELCAAVKQDPALQFVPVILLTADASTPSRIAGLAAGADDFLVKPFHPVELKARIENLLATRRAWRAQLGEAGPSPLPFEDAFADRPAADEALRSQLQDVVHEHFTDGSFSAGPFAEAVGLSPAHLRRKTQELFGLAPTELIRRYRLRQAAALLARKTGTVAEIAYSVGFNSVSYFARAFRDLYEVVPSAYEGEAVKEPVEED